MTAKQNSVDLMPLKSLLEKESKNLKGWSKHLHQYASLNRNRGLLHDSFSKINEPLYQNFGYLRQSYDTYASLVTEQSIPNLQPLYKKLSYMLARCNELVRKQYDDKHVVELKNQWYAYLVLKEKTIKDMIYLQLNYKMDIYCRGIEAEMKLLQRPSSPTDEMIMSRIFG